VYEALAREIRAASGRGPLSGITSLAIGADQLFAEMILHAGGTLHVIIPSEQYEATFDTWGRDKYRMLLVQASEVEQLAFYEPTEEAFFAAGKRIVDLCETLLAIWDGQPSRGLGGTADVVHYAQESGHDVGIIWPAGVTR
jgi:hypothetical protein